MAKDADGNQIKVGQVICFKSDIEQSGVVTKVSGRDVTIKSHCDRGFSGDYIGGQTLTVERADRCWAE